MKKTNEELIAEKLDRSSLLEITNEILKDSKLSREDSVKLGEEAKRAVAKRHGLL